MGLVICPECKNDVSQYAESCPTCGFPIKQFMESNNLNDVNKVFICPKCANVYKGYSKSCVPLHIKCEYCNTTVIQTNEDPNKTSKFFTNASDEDADNFSIELAITYGNNQFDKISFDDRLQKRHIEIQKYLDNLEVKVLQQQNKPQNTNTPHCPTCNSTNIHKISVTSKAINAGLFGLLGNKRKKQFHCNNCGYEW